MTMVESSFDWWQKDMFFSAAEEVQQSADIMESVYRTWERERRDRFQSDDLEELGRELLTALGITKWQLEEFDKAVKLSHQKCSGENTIARHRQFVVAIETQVSRVEKALGDSRIEEGKQPLRWVQLDEDERDDLALFLTGPAGTSEESKGSVDFDASSSRIGTQSIKDYKEIVTINQDAKYVVELAAKELPKLKEEMLSPRETSNGKTKIWSSPDIGAWKISIADEDVHKSLEATPKRQPLGFNISNLLRYIKHSTKLNWCRNSFRKAKSEEDLNVKTVSSYVDFRGVHRLTRLFGQVGGFRREVESSQCYMKFSRSLQVTLILILTFFLIVPFMIYVS